MRRENSSRENLAFRRGCDRMFVHLLTPGVLRPWCKNRGVLNDEIEVCVAVWTRRTGMGEFEDSHFVVGLFY